LADLTKQGKVVVLEWYNPECPAVHEHHKGNTFFNELHESYNSKGVVFLAVNSSAAGKEGSDKQRNIDSIKEFNLPYPILLDPEGTVGKSYGAKTTPHVFIVGKDGKLVYQGAAMDRKDRTNYVKAALDETLAGKPVTKAETKSWGCSVKYASK
ncbi:MAG TPA: redoxin family protein, partial [Phycisphaerales bacterium]|nr:redoxin family protein [Phycisphaerales bacterium]